MNPNCIPVNVQVCFSRKPDSIHDSFEDDHAQVCVGTNCVLGYLAEDDPHSSCSYEG